MLGKHDFTSARRSPPAGFVLRRHAMPFDPQLCAAGGAWRYAQGDNTGGGGRVDLGPAGSLGQRHGQPQGEMLAVPLKERVGRHPARISRSPGVPPSRSGIALPAEPDLIAVFDEPGRNLDGYGLVFVAGPRDAQLHLAAGDRRGKGNFHLRGQVSSTTCTPPPRRPLAPGCCWRNWRKMSAQVAGCPPSKRSPKNWARHGVV